MSAPRTDVGEADRLARVKLSCTIEAGDLRVTGWGASSAPARSWATSRRADVDGHWAFSIGQRAWVKLRIHNTREATVAAVIGRVEQPVRLILGLVDEAGRLCRDGCRIFWP